MEKDLKTQNLVSLGAIYVGLFLAVVSLQWGTQEVLKFSGPIGQQTVMVAVVTVIGALLSHLMPNSINPDYARTVKTKALVCARMVLGNNHLLALRAFAWHTIPPNRVFCSRICRKKG